MATYNLNGLKKLTEQYKQQAETVAKASLIRVGNMVISQTPKDTGRAQGNWNSAYGAPNTSTDDGRRIGGSQDELKVSVNGLEVGTEFYFTNNLPYISGLEYLGKSQQAPDGMLRVSIAKFPVIVDEEVRKVKG